MGDHNFLGVCPICYFVVRKDQPYVMEMGKETIVYHRDCEPRRMKWIRENQKDWAEIGSYFRNLRIESGFTVAEVAEDLGISESKLRKFEAGKPVTHAKLLSRALAMYFELSSIKVDSALSR